MTDHHTECETLRSLSAFCPCICPQLEFHSGRAIVLAMDGLRDRVEALDYEMLGRSEYVRKDNVLALVDGGADGG